MLPIGFPPFAILDLDGYIFELSAVIPTYRSTTYKFHR
jgi:hypothetical protein